MSAKPLKEAELRELATCAGCGKKLGQTGIPSFWKVSVERHLLHLGNIQRQNALGTMLGSGGLAMRMGPDEDMTIPTLGPLAFMVCEGCALELNLPAAAERAEDMQEQPSTTPA